MKNLLLLTILLVFAGCNEYPLRYKIGKDDFDKRRKLEAQFLSDRDMSIITDTIPVGNLRFGMRSDEILEQVRKAGISNDIFFGDYTDSRVEIAGCKYNCFIKYDFDTLNLLRSVTMKFDNTDKCSLLDNIKDQYGNKYFEEDYSPSRISLTWLNGNQRVIFEHNMGDEDITIRYIDDKYNGKIFYGHNNFYDPIQASIDREHAKITANNFKPSVFLDFQFGMSEDEVEMNVNELIARGIKCHYDSKSKVLTLDYFRFNNNDSLAINDIRFVFFKSQLYEINIDARFSGGETYTSSRANAKEKKLFNSLLAKYGKYSYRLYPSRYVWIMQDMKIDFCGLDVALTNTILLKEIMKNPDYHNQAKRDIEGVGNYHTLDGTAKQIQYQGSQEQKNDLDAIDEYARTHPGF